MRIAEGIEVLELAMITTGNAPPNIIHPTLVWDQNHVILMDTGLPIHADQIREAMNQAGVPFQKLSHIILTHQDVDHIGGMADLLQLLDHPVEVLAHEDDRPYMEGELPLIKWNPERMSKLTESLPEEARKKFAEPPKAKISRTIKDGEVLPYCGGITVVFTPGHTPGHISLYLNPSKVLVTGDALNAPNGQLQGPNAMMTPNMDEAMKSIGKFTQLDVDTIICYHGGVIRDNANEQLARVVETANKS